MPAYYALAGGDRYAVIFRKIFNVSAWFHERYCQPTAVQKQKARAEKEKHADQNRVLFGRTKSEKVLTQAEMTKAQRFLDHNRLEKSDKPDAEK